LKYKNTECFEKVVDSCHKKIVAQTKNNKQHCFYEVPMYVFGFPIFDLNKCIEYLINSLESDGFFVKYYFPKYLYISWDFDEINANKKEKIQTMQQNETLMSLKPSGKLQLNLF
jgi:hypothetical protein